ncbi:MAG: hypothetical protein ACKO3W_09615 [bacterium]
MANAAQQTPARSSTTSDGFAPLLSAVIFGYYGFLAGLDTHGSDGEPIALWITFVWVLRAATVLYAACAVLAWRGRPGAELAYGVVSALATAGLAAVFVWDIASPDNTAVHPLIMVVLLLWNGYGAYGSIRAGLARG